jgi:uncharacterized membrane protein
MLVKNVSNALLGGFLSLIATYLFIVSLVLKNEIASAGGSSINLMDLFIGAPAYVLAFTFWIVIPIGLLFGLVIPLLVRKKTTREALVYGILIGAIAGLLFAWFGAYEAAEVGSFSSDGPPDGAKWWVLFWGQFASLAPLTIVYSSIWTGGYAFIKAGGAGVEREASLT